MTKSTTAPPATQRLAIRELEPADLDPMAELLGDPRTLEHWPKPLTREEARRWIERQLESYRTHGIGLWALVRRDTGELIGDCGLTHKLVEGTDEIEVGYHLHRRHWGRGFATEAALACRDHARQLGVERLIALILPANVRSQGVARRIGLTPERDVEWASMPHVLWSAPLGTQ